MLQENVAQPLIENHSNSLLGAAVKELSFCMPTVLMGVVPNSEVVQTESHRHITDRAFFVPHVRTPNLTPTDAFLRHINSDLFALPNVLSKLVSAFIHAIAVSL